MIGLGVDNDRRLTENGLLSLPIPRCVYCVYKLHQMYGDVMVTVEVLPKDTIKPCLRVLNSSQRVGGRARVEGWQGARTGGVASGWQLRTGRQGGTNR